MPPKWASCANCGGSYPGMTTETCSSRCQQQLNAKRATGQPTPQPADRHRQPTDRRAKPTKPGPATTRKGCDLVLLPPVVGVAALLALVRVRRRR
jgi:hypothetical protein